MSVTSTLKDWLKGKIQGVSGVQEVFSYMPSRFNGYPSVAIVLPEIQGEFASTSTNERVYVYRIIIFMPLGKDLETPKTMPREQYAENVISEVVEGIINAIDTDFDLTAVTQSDNIVAKYANASDMRPFETVVDNGEHLAAELTISIYTEKTIT